MAYDPLAESLRLLADGLPEPLPAGLSRRCRFAPLSFDTVGDVAVTAFVRRGVSGEPWLETWALARRDGEWRLLGGGGGNLSDNPLAGAPSADELGGYLRRDGGGSTLLNSEHLLPWTGRYLSHALLRLAAEVHTVVVAGRRVVGPPPHGRQVVLWTARRAATVEAFAGDHTSLGRLDLGRP